MGSAIHLTARYATDIVPLVVTTRGERHGRADTVVSCPTCCTPQETSPVRKLTWHFCNHVHEIDCIYATVTDTPKSSLTSERLLHSPDSGYFGEGEVNGDAFHN